MIVIPMAGQSTRFAAAGYLVQKYKLDLGGETLFARSVGTFRNYFATDEFLFVLRAGSEDVAFVEAEASKLGIRSCKVETLQAETRGQAETVVLALRQCAVGMDEELLIFNIDTIRDDYLKPSFIDDCDGYLEVFYGEGTHWSFVELDEHGWVIRTTEKDRISDLCSSGLYHFRAARSLFDAFDDAVASHQRSRGEFYIAPLYNHLISRGGRIRYDLIEADVLHFAGTPLEYEDLVRRQGSGEPSTSTSEGA